MRDITCFSANVVAKFDNNYENMLVFNDLQMDAANRNFTKYSASETGEIIRNQYNKILGVDFKNATRMQRRQAWRAHGLEICSVIENVLADRMVSGWDATNARFMDLVEDVNIARGDMNYFTVNNTALLQVSKWSSNHHDIVRQKVLPGKGFSIDTSSYVIKVYTDFEMFMLGKVDFAGMIDLMYKSIEKYRYSALYTAFMSLDSYLPSDMKSSISIVEASKDSIIDKIEAVKATTGKDVMLVGTRVAMQKLQNTVNYTMWSNDMKQERHEKGMLGMWEGYECLVLDRVNEEGTRTSIFTAQDNKKIFIIPIDDSFKPIKRVNEGDVEYFERGMQGDMQDRTIEAEIWYHEGVGIVIDELFGVIVDNS